MKKKHLYEALKREQMLVKLSLEIIRRGYDETAAEDGPPGSPIPAPEKHKVIEPAKTLGDVMREFQ